MSASKKYGKKAELALNTWIKLARTFNSFNKKSIENIRKFGLTQAQFSVIEILGHLGPMKVGEICNKMLVTGGNMTLVLDNIEKLGYLERIQCKDDRRALIIQLTVAGKNLFEEIFKHHAEHIGKLMSVITPSEQKQLGELLKKLGLAVSKLS